MNTMERIRKLNEYEDIVGKIITTKGDANRQAFMELHTFVSDLIVGNQEVEEREAV